MELGGEGIGEKETGKEIEDRIGAGGGAGAQARARTEAWLHTPVLKDEDGNAPVDTEDGVGEICLLDLEEWPCAWWRRHQDEQW
jgi:hypothetical protein